MFDAARWVLSKDKKFVDSVNMAMKMIAWAIPVLVTGLKLKHLGLDTGEFYHAVESTPFASWLLALSLVIFYSSWIFGAYFDLDMQKEVYVIAPEQKLSLRDLGVMIAVGVTFGVLGYFLNRPVIFAVILLAYWIVNVLAWRYLVNAIISKVRPDSAERHVSESRHVSVAKLAAVGEYMEGGWQWWRFAIGGILVAVLLGFLLATSPAVTNLISRPASSLPIAAMLFFVFVCLVESWMWFKRFATLLRLTCFDVIDSEYVLTPRPKPGHVSP